MPPVEPTNQEPSAELPIDHPATDSNIDSTELYHEGISGAAEVQDNTSKTAVTGYTPSEDEVEDLAL